MNKLQLKISRKINQAHKTKMTEKNTK